VDSQQNNNIFLQTSVQRTMMRMLYQPIDRGRYLVDEITSIFLSGVQQGLDTGRTCDIIPPLFGAASSLSVTKWQSTQMTVAVFVVCSATLFLGPGTNFWVLTTSGIKTGIHGINGGTNRHTVSLQPFCPSHKSYLVTTNQYREYPETIWVMPLPTRTLSLVMISNAQDQLKQ
jgi:hypothetical protein